LCLVLKVHHFIQIWNIVEDIIHIYIIWMDSLWQNWRNIRPNKEIKKVFYFLFIFKIIIFYYLESETIKKEIETTEDD
jgi:hypothetical protein